MKPIKQSYRVLLRYINSCVLEEQLTTADVMISLFTKMYSTHPHRGYYNGKLCGALQNTRIDINYVTIMQTPATNE